MFKKILILILIFIFSGIYFSNCFAADKVIKSKKLYDCNGKFIKAKEKYFKKKYFEANNILTEVLSNCPGHDAYDSMLYFQAKTLLGLKKYQDAKTEFERIVQTYPNSNIYEESFYLLGYCMFLGSNSIELDQSSTKEAKARLYDFLETFPQSIYADSAKIYIEKADEKLAEKEFQTAKFYEKIEKYESAVVYYKILVQEYPNSKLVPSSLLGIAENLIKANRINEAIQVLDDLLSQTKDESIIKKAQALKNKIKK